MKILNTNISIQPVLTQEQISIVSNLAEKIWSQHFTSIIGGAQVEYMLEKFQSEAALSQQIEKCYRYYLACDNDSAQGYCAIVSDSETNKLLLSKLYVLASRRQKGLGSSMLDYVEQTCRQEGMNAIKLTVNRYNQSSIDWYRQRGFQIVDQVKTDIGAGFYMDDFIMEKAVK